MPFPIYLDNQATTPVDPMVLEDMLPYFTEKYGNAASVHHRLGQEAKEAVEMARKIIAQELNAAAREIIFTSGATESINLSIRGVCEQYEEKGKHIITQVTEHNAVLDTVEAMSKKGWNITLLPVDPKGHVNPESIQNAIRPDTVMVTIMHGNNEIGTLQPIGEIGKICREKRIFFHVDASQTFGKLPIDTQAMNIDLLAATSHKIYGPKGIGCLFIRQKNPKVKIKIQMEGGGHERGMRSGTLPVPLIVGFGRAVQLCVQNRNSEYKRIGELRDLLFEKIQADHPDIFMNGCEKQHLPNNLNICFPGLDSESLITRMKGIACSTGSACTSANLEPSHVLKAIGLNNELAHASIRFSLGRFNTEEEILMAIEEINRVVSAAKEKSQHLNMTSS